MLELINKFSKVARYKVNFQNSVAFLHTNNEILEKEYKNIIPFKIAPQKIKYGVPVVAQWLTNPTRNHEVAGSVPGLAQWVDNPALP